MTRWDATPETRKGWLEMTIDELLEEAARFAAFAVREADRDRIDNERIMRYCAIAQACAMTAGAMVQAAWWTERQADNDPAEVTDAAVYDAYRAEWERQERENAKRQ